MASVIIPKRIPDRKPSYINVKKISYQVMLNFEVKVTWHGNYDSGTFEISDLSKGGKPPSDFNG